MKKMLHDSADFWIKLNLLLFVQQVTMFRGNTTYDILYI